MARWKLRDPHVKSPIFRVWLSLNVSTDGDGGGAAADDAVLLFFVKVTESIDNADEYDHHH